MRTPKTPQKLYKRSILEKIMTKEELKKLDEDYFHQQIKEMAPQLQDPRRRKKLIDNILKKYGI